MGSEVTNDFPLSREAVDAQENNSRAFIHLSKIYKRPICSPCTVLRTVTMRGREERAGEWECTFRQEWCSSESAYRSLMQRDHIVSAAEWRGNGMIVEKSVLGRGNRMNGREMEIDGGRNKASVVETP